MSAASTVHSRQTTLPDLPGDLGYSPGDTAERLLAVVSEISRLLYVLRAKVEQSAQK